MHRPINMLALSVFAAGVGFFLVGCGGNGNAPKQERHQILRPGLRDVIIPRAVGPVGTETKWVTLNAPDIAIAAAAVNTSLDEDVVALFVEVLPLDRPVTGAEDLRNYLAERAGPEMRELAVGDLIDYKVVHFASYEPEPDGSPELVVSALRIGRRPTTSEGSYFLRRQGIVVPHPANPMEAIRVGIWRNSFHGMIGGPFEEVGVKWVEDFLLDNELVISGSAEPSSAVNSGDLEDAIDELEGLESLAPIETFGDELDRISAEILSGIDA